jgi:hypothetical protein
MCAGAMRRQKPAGVVRFEIAAGLECNQPRLLCPLALAALEFLCSRRLVDITPTL